MVTPFSQQASIQPDTVFCVKGSEANPISYCADSTPCKTIKGATGASHQVCLAGTVNPPAGAVTISSACWDLKVDYTCMQYVTDCTNYSSNPDCTEIGTGVCLIQTPTTLNPGAASRVGSCLSTSRRFSCLDKAATTNPVVSLGCETSTTLDGLNWSTQSDSAANDFIQSATSAEIARQLSTYGNKDGGSINNLFPGFDLRCRNKLFGLGNCCDESPSGSYTNNALALKMNLAISGFKMGAGYAMKFGSNLVEDFMMQKAAMTFAEPGLMGMFQSVGVTANSWSSFSSTFSLMGFGLTKEAAASSIGSFAGLYDVTSSFQLGSTGVYFNPYSFAISIGIKVVMSLLSCNQDERDLANVRRDGLCVYIGEYCSWELKFLGKTIACLETTSSYCCYNGLLGKAIEEGAHSQLGLGWGSAKAPACGGLTPDQLSALDFTTTSMKAALQPFQNQIMKSYQSNMQTVLTNGSVKSDVAAKNVATSNTLCLQRKKLDASTVCN